METNLILNAITQTNQIFHGVIRTNQVFNETIQTNLMSNGSTQTSQMFFNGTILVLLLVAAGALLLAAVIWPFTRARMRAGTDMASGWIDAARREAETVLRDARAAAHDELFKARETFERETKERRQELADLEKRVLAREVTLERKTESSERKVEELARKDAQVTQREKELYKLQMELDKLKQLSLQELQRISGFSPEDAKKSLLVRMEEDARAEGGAIGRRILDEAKQNADREAKKIITTAIERCASDHVQTATSCTITLPNEEMKGRIIGREGRNIRAFEAATGINVVIDDTPQVVVLSGFDPVRREVARLTLDRLIADGRINPARIEEEVVKVTEEMQAAIRQAGEEAVIKLGLHHGVHPDLVDALGRLKFRHSFAQNVLDHCIEVGQIAGSMAAELGLDQQLAKRIGLFHDIGKAVNHEVEGTHAIIGGDMLKKCGEPEEVWQAVACHHHEAEPTTLYGMLVSAADAISASRPGARSESMEFYLQRLEKLEAIANSFSGVEKSYALQAGREIRVIVEPSKVGDNDAAQLARDITKKIEQEVQYPGQIKVTVVRETRAVEFAK
jgi:ribonuclease Y